MKVKIESKDANIVTRSGITSTKVCTGGIDKCKLVSKPGETITTCCCTSNLCNSALSIQKLSVRFMIMIILTVVAYPWM
ncbi:unnamed protein product [Rotaria magnacalcarata]